MTEHIRFCGACGFKVPRDAAFCGGCGQALPPWSEIEALAPKALGRDGNLPAPISAARARRSPLRSLLRFVLRAAVVLVLLNLAIGLGFGLYELHQRRQLQAALAPAMPPLDFEHPSGVRVEVPEGGFPEGFQLKVELLDQGPEPEPLERRTPFLVFDGAAIQTGPEPAQVLIPVEGDSKNCTVLVESVGRWIPVPSVPTRSKDGRDALQVQIDGLPLPWRLTVASSPAEGRIPGPLVQGETLARKLVRLEQLRIVDRKAFLEEINKLTLDESLTSLDERSSWRSLFASPAYAQRKTRPKTDTFSSVTLDLDRARLAFLRASAHCHNLGQGRDATRLNSAVKLYQDGLAALLRAKNGLHKLGPEDRSSKIEDFDPETEEVIFGSNWELQHLVEQYCGTFAPWGIELTSNLLSAPDIHSRGFDVRVVPHFGSLIHVDIALARGKTPLPLYDGKTVGRALDHHQRQWAEKIGIVPEQAMRFEVLRLYSPNLYNWTNAEILSALKNVSSAVGSAIGVATLASNPPAGAALYLIYFEIAVPFIDFFFTPTIAEMTQESEIAGQFAFYTAYDGLKLATSLIIDKKTPTMGRTGWIDLLLNLVIDYEGILDTEALRLESARTVGYTDRSGWVFNSEFQVPPILVLANIYGPTKHRPPHQDGSYVSRGWGTLQFSLTYGNIAHRFSQHHYNLTQAFARKRSEISEAFDQDLVQASRREYSVYGSEWRPSLEKQWRARVLDEAPHVQVIQWVIPNKVLDQWAKQANLKRQEFLDQVSVAISLESQPKTRRFFAAGQAKGEVSLAKLLQPQSHRTESVFGAALAPQREGDFRQRLMAYEDNWTEANFGPWASMVLLPYHDEPRQRFKVTLSHGSRELLSFPIGFHEFAPGDGFTSLDSVLESGAMIEIVTARPDIEKKIDLMEFLLAPEAIPGKLEETKRERSLDAIGKETIEHADQRLANRDRHLQAAPRIDYRIPVGDFESPEAERAYRERMARDYILDERGQPIRPKESARKIEMINIGIRITRVSHPKLQDQVRKELSGVKELLESGQEVWENGPSEPEYLCAFMDGDLTVAFRGQNNSEATRQTGETLRQLMREHFRKVRARHASSAQ